MSAAPVLVMIPGVLGGPSGADQPYYVAEETAPQLRVTDYGATRGDGVFETIGVFRGQALNLEPHLTRLGRSARMLDLPAPDTDVVREAFQLAVDTHAAVDELMVRIILTRGVESADEPTAWVHAKQSPDFSAERAGVRVVSLSRGVSSTVASDAPWLLAGAKSTSYAVNMAALREARRRSADDVLFVSTDGYALEGPTSTLLVRRGDSYSTTPPSAGVLPGTTVASAQEVLASRGAAVEEKLMTLDEVRAADAAWLLSSVRLAAPITQIDDVELAVDAELTAALCAGMSFGVVAGA